MRYVKHVNLPTIFKKNCAKPSTHSPKRSMQTDKQTRRQTDLKGRIDAHFDFIRMIIYISRRITSKTTIKLDR